VVWKPNVLLAAPLGAQLNIRDAVGRTWLTAALAALSEGKILWRLLGRVVDAAVASFSRTADHAPVHHDFSSPWVYLGGGV